MAGYTNSTIERWPNAAIHPNTPKSAKVQPCALACGAKMRQSVRKPIVAEDCELWMAQRPKLGHKCCGPRPSQELRPAMVAVRSVRSAKSA